QHLSSRTSRHYSSPVQATPLLSTEKTCNTDRITVLFAVKILILVFPQHQQFAYLDFCHIFFLPLLIIVAAVDKLTFKGDFLSLVKILGNQFRNFSPGNKTVPLGFFHFISIGITINLIG